MQRSKLSGIQSLRAIAALAVVIYHVETQLVDNMGYITVLQDIDLGARGVSIFFVLSGFIIYNAHRKEFCDRSKIGIFAYKRLSRIIPFTFLAASLWAVIVSLASMIDVQAPGGTFISWINSAFVLPFSRPYPGVIWSLRHELLFYFIFLLTFISPLLFWFSMVTWSLLSIFIATGTPFDAVTPWEIIYVTAFSDANALFIIGLIVGVAHRKLPEIYGTEFFFALCLFAVGIASYTIGDVKYDISQNWIFGCLCGALTFFAARSRLSSMTLSKLGDASFSIYLVHAILLPLVYVALSKFTTSGLLIFLSEVFLLSMAGVLAYEVLERPLMRFFRSRAFGASKHTEPSRMS